ncbi:uncharacterized protein LOC132740696 [Ruditapes philippinarum]|uniref:uncharacterized protein LOC132740696 n=1 Tax=Ruditapes philippinarum TaxID=129788 RepID=UPI00295BD6E7|nr:uncharacterized protein LOC132740696 [Ruditapes philippinarum]
MKMAVSIVLYVTIFLTRILYFVYCDCSRNGDCCDKYQCEYSLFKKFIELESKLGSLEIRFEENRKESENAPRSGGSTYVRWGRTSCTGRSKEVYNGYAAGTDHNQIGGAGNAVCLTNHLNGDDTRQKSKQAPIFTGLNIVQENTRIGITYTTMTYLVWFAKFQEVTF